jgi:hypothetical protein
MEVSKPAYLQVLHPPRDREPLALDFFLASAVTKDIDDQILLRFSTVTLAGDIHDSSFPLKMMRRVLEMAEQVNRRKSNEVRRAC